MENKNIINMEIKICILIVVTFPKWPECNRRVNGGKMAL